MQQGNIFEEPNNVLQDIMQQAQQQQLSQLPHIMPQQRQILSTFTAASTQIPTSSSTPTTTSTTPSPLALPSIVALSSEQQIHQKPSVNRPPKPGILRLDMNKPRRSSGGSVEFRSQPQMHGTNTSTPTGITPTSSHQLSVTWATPPSDTDGRELKIKPTQTTPGAVELNERKRSQENKPYEYSLSYAANNPTSPVRETFADFPLQRHFENNNTGYVTTPPPNADYHDNVDNDDVDDEEDYSISVSAIMQKRASVRGYRRKNSSRNSRRASSPMDHVLESVERRRSSVYTTSSDEGTNQESTQEQIFENIRLHKEVIQSVKLQPWPIRKKLKLVRQAKTYVARHEGALQERFAMSRSTRDLWARFKILMAARWRHWKRETASFLTVLIPWELRIKEIESHFGSGVASYFTFLRWLMWVNVMIALPIVIFVIGPEYFATKHDETDPRKKMSSKEYEVAGNLFTIWEFEGYLKYSPMFYGYYSSYSGASSLGYMLPLAYFLTAVAVYIYSFVATLRNGNALLGICLASAAVP